MKNFLKSLTVILFSVLSYGQNLPNINTGTKGQLPTSRLNAPGVAGLCLETDGSGNVVLQTCSSGGGSGTVTNFSASGLSPLFSSAVANPTTTPSLAFTLSNFAPHTFLGNNTSGSAQPGAQSIGLGDLPGSGSVTINTSSPLGGGGSLSLGNSLTLTCASCVTSIPQQPITKAAVTSNWIRSYDSTTGLFVASQPAYSDISGTPQLAITKAAIASNWLRSYDSTTGLFTATQPAYTDISGTPTLPSTLGSAASKWINSYSSVTGLFTATQPASSDLSDFPSQATHSGQFLTTNGTVLSWGSPSGSGTVTTFSSGNLSPLFTTSVATATTTPAQSFSLSTAAAHTFFGNNTASTAAPAYEAIGNGDLPGAGAITLNTTAPITGGGSVALGSSLTFACASCLTSVTAHNLLSATHGDTTTHTVSRGDLIAGIGVAPSWTAVAKGGTNTYPKWNASGDVIASTNPASGTGSPTTCTNQAVTAFTLNADASPSSTCTTITSAFTSGTFTATAHNLLSATHGDTTPGSVVTGDVISGQSSAWARLGGNTSTTPQYFKSLGNGTTAAAPSWAQVAYTDLSGVPATFAPTAHNILSSSHSDTTAAAAVRGDGFFAIGVTPTWQRLAHPTTTGGYFKWNGTDIVASTLAAAGTGNCGANQFETGSNADATPTCAQPAYAGISGTPAVPTGTGYEHVTAGVLDSASKLVNLTASTDTAANQGTTTTLLHGNAAGQASFGSVVSADLNITSTTCTNQYVSAISSTAVGTCTTDVLASAQHANQGTTTTVLHGNGAGNPSFGAVSLTADVSGLLPLGNQASPTGTGFEHVTAGVIDGAAKLINLTAATDVAANQGTVNQVLHGNAAGQASFSAVTSADTTGTFPSTPHALLDGSVDSDTTAGTVARGDLITGQTATPKWTRLVKGSANQLLAMDATGTDVIWAAPPGGTGTVTSFSSGNLSPLFTSSVATATTTPALTFALSNAAANTVFGNNTGGSAAPGFQSMVAAQEPSTTVNSVVNDTNVTGSIAAQALTLGWTGTLSKARNLATAVYTDQSNTYSASTTQAMDTITAKYWGSAPIFDATQYSGTDMCDKIVSVYSDAAYIAAPVAIVNASGFTGNQNCATQNPFSTTHSTKWIFNAGLHVNLTRFAGTIGPATSSLIAAPSSPSLSTSTSGGSLAAAIGVGVKIEYENINGSTTPSVEATITTGAGATNSVTVTSPAVSFGATCYDVFSATPVGSGWKKNNTTGCIPLGVNYVIKTIGAGSIPDTTNTAANDQYEVDFGGSTWSAGNSSGAIIAAISNTYIHDLSFVSNGTSNNGNALVYVNSSLNNVLFERITCSGAMNCIAAFTDTNVTFNHIRCGNPTQSGSCVSVISNGTNIRIFDVQMVNSVWPAGGNLQGVVNLSGCVDCTVDGVIAKNLDISNLTNGAAVIIQNGSLRTNVSNVNCDGLINSDCIAVLSSSLETNVNNVHCSNTAVGTGAGIGANTNNGDCLDFFGAGRISANNVKAQSLGLIGGLRFPCFEFFDDDEIDAVNINCYDSTGEGLRIFGSPRTTISNSHFNRNGKSGVSVEDSASVVTCNNTTTATLVSGNPIGPWNPGTKALVGAGPTTFVIASTTASTVTFTATCNLGASQAFTVPSTDVGLIGVYTDANGTGTVGANAQSGISVTGHSVVTIVGGSMNDDKPVQTQQWGISTAGGFSRVRVLGSDYSGNLGATCSGIEYGANVAGNHGFCDANKLSSQLVDDNIGPKWTMGASQTTDASLNLPVGVDPTSPVSGDFWNDGTTIQYRGPNNTLVQNLPAKIWLTGNYTNSTTSLTNVTSGNTLAFPVAANQTYAITCELFYQAASTGGLQIGFTGPASPTAVNYSAMIGTTATTINNGESTAFATKIPTVGVASTATTNFPAHIALMLRNGANAGTVTLQAASVAAVQLTINNTSFCTIQ